LQKCNFFFKLSYSVQNCYWEPQALWCFLFWSSILCKRRLYKLGCTGKSVSKALIVESVNPQYDKKNTSWQHVVYKNCFLFWHSKQYLYTTCCQLVFFMEFNEQSAVILWAGLSDARMRTSEKDLPVSVWQHFLQL
jgi:hypothetical protein